MSRTDQNNYVVIEGYFKVQTAKAIGICRTELGARDHNSYCDFFPKSLVGVVRGFSLVQGHRVELQVPEWLAEKNGYMSLESLDMSRHGDDVDLIDD